jgi:uncharacterized delta-60 repeat protein
MLTRLARWTIGGVRAPLRAILVTNGWLACGLALLASLLVPTLAEARPGDLDHSFGGSGKVRTSFAGRFSGADSVVIDSRRRIVAAGSNQGGFVLARYKPSGNLDRSFSRNGKVTTDFGKGNSAASAAIDSRDRIVIAGDSAIGFIVTRYRPNGRLDRSFGSRGRVTTDFGGRRDDARAVAIDSRGRIVAAGVVSGRHPHHSDFALARYIG